MTTHKVYGDYPIYFRQPIRWMRYHAHNSPHFFWSIAMGLSAPLLIFATPLRRKLLYKDHESIPKVYPLPNRERDANLKGYDDE